jgi:hypothetical protein
MAFHNGVHSMAAFSRIDGPQDVEPVN